MSARTVVVVGAAGGCGASLVASGLALAGAGVAGPVTLIDLDLSGGDLAGAWGLRAQRTLDDLAAVAGTVTADHLRRAAVTREDGIRMVAATAGESAGAWTAEHAGQLVAVAAATGPVVVDAGSGLTAGAGALEIATGAVLVCPATVGGARRAAVLLDRWRRAGIDERLALVWARGPGGGELSPRALERLLGVHVAARLPWAPREARDLAAGRWPSGRRRPLRAAIETLAEALA